MQVLIIFFTREGFQVVRLPGREWGITIALGFGSIPVGALCRLTPSGRFEQVFKKLGFLGRDRLLPTESPEAEGWSGAISHVRDNLSTFANIRGGRVRASSFVARSRTALRRQPEKPTLGL